MKRKPRFFIGFLAAAITFGTLMATIGPRHYKHHTHHCGEKAPLEKKNNASDQENNR